MQESEEKSIYYPVIELLKKTKEVIDFAHQMEVSLRDGSIEPEDIIKMVYVGPENDDYLIERDWTKFENDLKSDFSNILKVNIVGYQIIVLKQSYVDLFIENNLKFAVRSSDPDLWAAQEILRHTRNALGHMWVDKSGEKAQATWDFSKDKCLEKLEVISIGVMLDTTDLQGVAFKWEQIGGIKKFHKVLDYLIEDLSNR